MIKLLVPYNRGGRIIPAGTEINLPAAEEDRLIVNKSAEAVVPEEKPVVDEEQLAEDLDNKFNKEPLAEAAQKAGVTFDEKATKKEIIAAVIEQGKAEELLKEGE